MDSPALTYCFLSSRRRHTRCSRDWSSDVCSSDLDGGAQQNRHHARGEERQPDRHQPAFGFHLDELPVTDHLLVLREIEHRGRQALDNLAENAELHRIWEPLEA